MARAYRHFNDMTWPVPGERLSEINRALVYGEPTKEELLVCASVLSAYRYLIELSIRERNEIIRELRKGPAFSSETSPQIEGE